MFGPAETMVMLASIMGATFILHPIARAIGRYLDRRASLPPAPRGDDQRLERIEAAVESIAIEIERISEGQRFTTNLLAERTGIEPTRRAGAGPHG